MAEKITIKTCVLEKTGTSQKGKPYTIYTVTDIADKKYQSFEEFKESENCEVVITPDATGKGYIPHIKRLKPLHTGKTYIAKDTKRETALTCAVNSKFDKQLSSADILKLADKYYQWLVAPIKNSGE